MILVFIYKLSWGTSEILLGLLFLSSGLSVHGEFATDPQDQLVSSLLHHLSFNAANSVHLGILLIAFGLIKYLIAGAIWFASWAMRRWLIILLCCITLYAAVVLAVEFSAFKLVTLAADVFILIYLWKLLPKHLQHHAHVPAEF